MLSMQYMGSGAHIKRLEQIAARARVKPRKAMEQIGKTIVQANMLDRREGIQADGTPMPPLRTKRLGIYKDAKGPPLAPFADAAGRRSKSIALFRTELYEIPNGLILAAGWVDGPMRKPGKHTALEILGFHARGIAGAGKPITRKGQIVGWRGVRGRTSKIVRDIFGISPRSWKLVREAIRLAFDGYFR
jgi:hypothetical protein